MCPPLQLHFPTYYLLICPKLHQAQNLKQYGCSTTSRKAFFKLKIETWFWNTFAKPVQGIQRVQTFHPKVRPGGKLSLLERLPSDLIEEILDHLLRNENSLRNDVEAVLALGLSSDRLRPKVLHRVHRDYQHALSTNWVGKEVGYESTFSYRTNSNEPYYDPVKDAFVFPEPTMDGACKPSDNQPESRWRESATAIRDVCTDISDGDLQKVEQDLSQMYLYPQNRVWVLRNLTTRQFVRSDRLHPPARAIPSVKAYTRIIPFRLTFKKIGKYLRNKGWNLDREPLTLAQVFLILTSHAGADDGNFRPAFQDRVLGVDQGPWTGHAFDVVTLEDHLHGIVQVEQNSSPEKQNQGIETEKEVWADVSELVAADAGNLRWCIRQCEEVPRVYKRTKRREIRRIGRFWDVIEETRKVHRDWAAPETVQVD